MKSSKLSLLVVLLFSSSLTFAGNSKDDDKGGNAVGVGVGVGVGIGVGGSIGNVSTGGSNSSGQTSNVNVTSDFERAAAMAYAPSIQPTATCMGSSSGGLSSPVFGMSVGGTWTSEECLILETARAFANAGQQEDANAIRCQAKYAKSAPTCIALKEKNATQQ
jgi:hypothetical protein